MQTQREQKSMCVREYQNMSEGEEGAKAGEKQGDSTEGEGELKVRCLRWTAESSSARKRWSSLNSAACSPCILCCASPSSRISPSSASSSRFSASTPTSPSPSTGSRFPFPTRVARRLRRSGSRRSSPSRTR
eukprot:156095-Rhodomonas_salina.1